MNVMMREKQGILRETQSLATRSRLNIVRMLEATPAGHVGGAMSCIDAVAVLYGSVLNVGPDLVDDPGRDRFLLSAGHKALAQYAVLAELGFFDKSVLDTYGKARTRLGGHPDMHKLPGVEGNTGALGHGPALGAGMALGLRKTGSSARTVVVMGDGELAEGSNWEGAAIAAHYEIDSLTAMIDINGLQISGSTAEVMNMGDVSAKFESFGWAVREVDGHDHAALHQVLTEPAKPGLPTAIVMKTVKGQGIASIAGTVGSHYWKPKPEELVAARSELEDLLAELADMPEELGENND